MSEHRHLAQALQEPGQNLQEKEEKQQAKERGDGEVASQQQRKDKEEKHPASKLPSLAGAFAAVILEGIACVSGSCTRW